MTNDVLLFVIIVILCILLLASYLGIGFIRFREGYKNATKETGTAIYVAPNGATAIVEHGTIKVTNPDGTTSIYTATSTSNTGKGTNTRGASGVIYYGPNGGTATVMHGSSGGDSISITGPDGGQAVVFQSSAGDVETATATATNTDTTNDDTSSTNTNTNTNTSYDNYNHYTGTSSPTIYYGPNGTTARVVDTNGEKTLVITNQNGSTEIYTIESSANTDPKVTTYIGTNGRKAVIAVNSDGKYIVSVTASDGSKMVYYEDNVYTYNSQTGNMNTSDEIPSNSGSSYDTAFDTNTYSGNGGGSINTITGPDGNTAASYDSGAYSNSLPSGIPRSQIQKGQEDLYILKSEVVPPVCPMCPNIICPEPAFDETKCGACPPCERISNNDFECKKVPNYSAGGSSSSFLPVPVISDFSGFGM